ncbi:MAG: 3'-5' exonuclease, partial [Nitrospinota bacterium]
GALEEALSRRGIPFQRAAPEPLHETDPLDFRAEKVSLLTLHAAKGLEFPVVFITGCEEGLIPYEKPGGTYSLEEERRLFYVGMTRAKRKLFPTRAKNRTLYGKSLPGAPSPFLLEIEGELTERAKIRRRERKPRPEEKQLSLL